MAGPFIRETVASVLSQSFKDFRVDIAIDPPEFGEDDTQTALERFRDDPRVHIVNNPKRLGWAKNFNAMFERVQTPFYVPLPHDDLWEPNYLATFLPMLLDHPEASVAYGDMTMFGANNFTGFRSVILPQGEDRVTHLIRFLLQGANAMPWRGVTRSSAIAVTKGFPTDEWGGFAVEVEYALGLLEAGPVIHVPKPLYQKRIFPAEQRVSASRARISGWTIEDRMKAWERHSEALYLRMLRMMSVFNASEDAILLAEASLKAAMLQRRQSMVELGLSQAEGSIFSSLLSRVLCIDHPLTSCVARQLAPFAR